MKKIISILLVIAWMALIFLMSSNSGTESSNQSGYIVNIIANFLNISNINTLTYIIRKLAHLTEYFILGLLVSNMINQYNKKISLSIIICIIYAISDEIHQALVPGRNPQLLDVLIDTLGAITGTIMLNLKYIFNKFKK